MTMSIAAHLRRWAQFIARLGSEDQASQIVEFALSVPLLVLFVVGIFDFSGALALKNKLANAAREGARVAAAGPFTDVGNPSGVLPASVSDAYQVVDNYLLNAKISDCGLVGTPPTATGNLTWQTTTGNCPGATQGLTLIITRGGPGPLSAPCGSPQVTTVGGITFNLVDTCVTLKYPYVWRFNAVAGLFSTFTGPTLITTKAVAFDEN